MRPTSTERQRRIRSVVTAVWGLLCALLFISTAGATGLMGLAVTGTIAGAAGTDDRASALRVPSVSDAVTMLDTADFPFLSIMQKFRKGPKPKQVNHQWGEVSAYARSVTIDGATTAGSANATKAVTVDTVSHLKPGDILSAPANATDGTLQYIVTAASGTTLTIMALPKDTTGTAPYTTVNYGTVPAFADNEVLYWQGNAKSQGDDASDPRAMFPAAKFNYVQTFDLTIEAADHLLRSENFGPQDWARMRRDNLREFKRNIGNQALFNEAPAVVADNADSKIIWKMGGLNHFANSVLSLSSSATYANIVDFLYSASSANNGSRRRTLFGGSDLMEVIDKVNTGSALNVVRGEKVIGIEITSLIGRKLRLDTIYEPAFDDQGRSAEGVIVDMDSVEWNDFAPLERRVQDFKNSAAGTDAEGEYYTQKSTLTARNTAGLFWVDAS